MATRRDSWLRIFSLMNHIAVIWALIIMAKRIRFFDAPKVMKILAFVSSSALIIFYLSLNMYKVYAFKTYGAKKGGHSHNAKVHKEYTKK